MSLSPQERQLFITAATRMLAHQERLQFHAEQTKGQHPQPGSYPIPESQGEMVMAPGQELVEVIGAITLAHRSIGAIRFRGRLFVPSWNGRQLMLAIVNEKTIEDVDG